MKRPLFPALIALAVVVLGAAWFLTRFEHVETRVWVGPSSSARANPYLAALRFLERNGMRARLEEQPAKLTLIAQRTTVVLLAGRAWMSDARVTSLRRWVDDGGHLMIEPEPPSRRDPLLDAFGVGRILAQPQNTTLTVSGGDDEAPLQIDAMTNQALDAQGANAEVLAADGNGARVIELRKGAGRVSIVTGMQRFDNRHIGRHDNAEMLRLLVKVAATDAVLFVRATDALPLWRWLAQHAAGALAAAAIVLALALWRLLPRFQPITPQTHPARRQLLEHLRAAGRYRWAHGDHSRLLDSARERLQRHIETAAPRLAHLDAEQRNAELSAQLGAETTTIRHAFEATPRTAREAVQIVRTLATIHAGLRGIARAYRPQRNRR